MPAAFFAAVARCIAEATGTDAPVVRSTAATGGSINQAQVVELADGRRFFVKSNPSPLPHLFERETAGLAALAAPGVFRVPRVIGSGGGLVGVPAFLVLEEIPTGRQGRGFFADFGRRLAVFHQKAQAPRFGFTHDNYLGSTPQPNGWCDSWCEFWRRHRLGHQLALARQNGQSDATLDRLGERLLERLETWLAVPDEPPCLLHGDLWGGNYLADTAGQPVLIDPAVYYGRREAELAMTRLFGGFTDDFYAAYEEVWPLAPGAAERLEIYKLYHLLNHLNLFGAGYRAGCLEILRHYAA